MVTEQEIEEMIRTYTPSEAELLRELLEEGDDE